MRQLIESTRSSGAGVLAALRAIAEPTSGYLSDAWQVAELQARVLRDLLRTPTNWLPATITELIPSITVELIESIPVAGTAFWGNNHWNIHLRASDEAGQQHHTLLHELKHIIDHPLRIQQSHLSPAEWEAVADHFADVVLGIGQPSLGEQPPANMATV